jgi:UDP-N-acetylmuramoylalanine--D-glutamate ligase
VIPITEFKGRDVAVFGLARSGLAAAKALAAGGAIVHAWDDKDAARAAAQADGVTASDINARDWSNFAALVLSPGVPLTHPRPHRVVELARSVGVPVIGDIELFARAVNGLAPHARPKVVGVTGTNGKSTTTALIGHILKSAGRDARVGGNIGVGVLDLEALHAGAYYVLELSSFQLDLTESLRCNAAVFLNLTPDHLDRHGTLADYLAAKRRVFRNQGSGDWAVVGVDDLYGAQICTERTAASREVAPISAGQALSRGVTTLGGRLYDALDGRAEFVVDLRLAPALPGRHNAQNAAAAYAACRAVGVSPREIAAGVMSFPGLAHRLEAVGQKGAVRFVNDSKATNLDAAATGLSVFPRVYWIAGGRAKEGGFNALARFGSRIVKGYFIGEASGALADAFEDRAPVVQCGALEAAVAAAYRDASASGEEAVVLFSPACVSFDQYRDFEQRGDHFKQLVAELIDPTPPAVQRASA